MNKTQEKFIENKFGYCCYVFDQEENETYAEIYNLFVYPEFRKQGKARKILQSVIYTIRGIGYMGEIRIEANPKENCISLEELILFYKRMGLKVLECKSEGR